jgi:hypothetical protein
VRHNDGSDLFVFLGCSLYFVKAHVPETKGLSLEQIEAQFRSLARRDRISNEGSNEVEPLLL